MNPEVNAEFDKIVVSLKEVNPNNISAEFRSVITMLAELRVKTNNTTK